MTPKSTTSLRLYYITIVEFCQDFFQKTIDKNQQE
nr:MAG TPA: hypothetical protein [Caudoviricetes sp.]